MLLEKGTDINVQGGEYDSAMQAASFRDHDQVVQMLLDQGADVIVQGGRYVWQDSQSGKLLLCLQNLADPRCGAALTAKP